jgi:tRNA threonylcarbamoyladenosine biosynthesis protein TsaB
MMMPSCTVPRILALDTSTPRGSVALLAGRDMRAEVRLHSVATHSESLLQSIKFLVNSQGWTLPDLDLIAAGIGPGSFTGIRIGVATALGIAQAASIPFAQVSGLDALAQQVSHLTGRIGAVLDAHRAQAFYAEYMASGGRIRTVRRPALVDNLDLEHHLKDRHLYLVGDHDVCRRAEKGCTGDHWPRIVPADLFLAAAIGQLACGNRRKWRSGEYVPAEPLYIRPPDALRKKAR